LIWSHNSDEFLITPKDGFDITFEYYDRHQDSAAPYENLVPPILHHIALSEGAAAHAKWTDVRQTCLNMHKGWDAFLWTDATADSFVAEHFPDLVGMWRSYRYPIQKIDSLRYMVLYHYGGVILDMDLQCNRALGPLRRFDFVAPAAHPTGFSIGFMMASPRNEFVGELVHNLERYNRHWLGLPYPTVMFSTGCHYASTIHAFQRDRSNLKILAGSKGLPNMHRLNGPVSTPLFDHLGSSSWHSYDAAMIVSLSRSGGSWLLFPAAMLCCGVCVSFVLIRRTRGRSRTRMLREKH